MHRNLNEIVHEFGFRVNLLYIVKTKRERKVRKVPYMPAEMGERGLGQ
jgi:hypothetical protein